MKQEHSGLANRNGPDYKAPWTPRRRSFLKGYTGRKPRVEVICKRGSNGDQEMAAAFCMAGFETWDVCMQDIGSGAVTVRDLDGAAFVGGFSFGDVLDSAKEWTGVASGRRGYG